MKPFNAVTSVTIWLAATLALSFSSQAESGDERITTAQQKHTSGPAIHIVDQKGRPVVRGLPSGTGQIVDVAVGQGGFVFVPDTVNISVGDTVRWTWATNNHSVTSGTSCTADGQFCSPDDMNCDAGTLNNTGFVYTHTFAQAGTFSYFCAAHCGLGMTGVVNVAVGPTPTPTPTPTATPTATASATPTASPTATPTATPSTTPSVTPSPSPTPTPTASATPGRQRPTPRPRPIPRARPTP